MHNPRVNWTVTLDDGHGDTIALTTDTEHGDATDAGPLELVVRRKDATKDESRYLVDTGPALDWMKQCIAAIERHPGLH